MTTHFWKKGTFIVKTSLLKIEDAANSGSEPDLKSPCDFYTEMHGEVFADLAIAYYNGIWRIFHIPGRTGLGIDCSSETEAKATVNSLINSGINWEDRDVLLENNITLNEYAERLYKVVPNSHLLGDKISHMAAFQYSERKGWLVTALVPKKWRKGTFFYNHKGEGLIEKDGAFSWTLPGLGLIKKEGWIFGHFGTSKIDSRIDGQNWGVLHIPTRNLMGMFETKKTAKRFAEKLMRQGIDWGYDSVEMIRHVNKKSVQEMLDLHKGLLDEVLDEAYPIEDNYLDQDAVIPITNSTENTTCNV